MIKCVIVVAGTEDDRQRSGQAGRGDRVSKGGTNVLESASGAFQVALALNFADIDEGFGQARANVGGLYTAQYAGFLGFVKPLADIGDLENGAVAGTAKD
jgi:hypothetical protein